MKESGVVYLTCDKGHNGAIVLDARRYQVLIQSGAKALLYGMANESISSLAGALERAYEFYIKVICKSKGIAPEVIDKAWAAVAKQSERQLGAFTFLYLLDQGALLELDQRLPTMRNKIIHSGGIATSQDALEFGEMVFKRIRQIEIALEGHEQSAAEEAEDELRHQEASVDRGIPAARLKTQMVRVRDGVGIGVVETFSEYVAALNRSIESGMS